MVNFDELNELYNCLDLYIVASRKECAITETPIIYRRQSDGFHFNIKCNNSKT